MSPLYLSANQDGWPYVAASYSLRVIPWTTQTGVQNSLAKKGPNDAPNNTKFGSWHTGVSLFVMGDGAVRPIRTNADPAILALLANRRDGKPVNVDDH